MGFQGLASIVKTRGNQDVHVILRGGTNGPNYSAEHVKPIAAAMRKARPEYRPSIMIDCSRKYPLEMSAGISQLSGKMGTRRRTTEINLKFWMKFANR
jgi:3-deoxy-D-arabino-heptulosonate 7-phosphate (DAHP) synthase